MAEPSYLQYTLVALATILLLTSCVANHQDERQEEQQVVRAQRLARARAKRARRARLERNRKRGVVQPTQSAKRPPPVVISNACDPAVELKRRAHSSLFNDRFAQAVRLVATPIRADLVELQNKPVQRFTFAVRMHPADEPRFGRAGHRAELLLDLRHVPLCSAGASTQKSVQLRVRLVLDPHKRPRTTVTTSLWPQRSRTGEFVIPVGRPIQLLLDPARATLRRGTHRAVAQTPQGVWEILAARFAGRPRTQRLSLATSELPVALRQLHVVEVVCGKKRDKQCRFLTRIQGRRALVTTWKELVKLAAPIRTMARVRQLHAAELSLRFPRCGGDARRASRRGGRHRCFGRSAKGLPCQFWRATKGYGNEAVVTARSDGFGVQHVVACPGKKLQVMALRSAYKRQGRHSSTVTDLTPRASLLLQDVRRLTSPGHRGR